MTYTPGEIRAAEREFQQAYERWFKSLSTLGKITFCLVGLFLQGIICVVWCVLINRAAECAGFNGNPAPPELMESDQ